MPGRPPDDFGLYGEFVYRFVEHYRGRIRYVQIWNEPNLFVEWGNRPVDPGGYVELLKLAYQRAKDPAQAAREYGVAVALEPEDMKALVGWARALAASGQPAACRRALAAIRKLDPDSDDAAEVEKSLQK